MVCVDMALALRGTGVFTLIPEPGGGEDARLAWLDQPPCILEVQVKGAAGTLTISNLVEYLAHYPARESRPSLLRRLMDEEYVYATFVLSARCGDELLELLDPGNRVRRPQSHGVSRKLVQAVREEVARRATELQGQKLTNLFRRRAEEQAELAQRRHADYRRALEKLVLVERETAESIEVRLHKTMQDERFESSAVRGVIARLTDEITRAKRTQHDVMPAVQGLLTKYAPAQIRPVNYLDRGIEDLLLGELRESSCLLLTGPPRAGKTWTSLAIGSKLQIDGVEVRTGSHIDEASRYLLDNVESRRAYILDDPLGSREAKTNPSAILGDLVQLSSRLRTGRYLIVVQTQNVLLGVCGTDDLSSCRVGSLSWASLAMLPVCVAKKIWAAAASAQNLTAQEMSRVASIIENDESLREPGALAYLAQTWSQLPDRPTDQEIVAQARRDAIDFARSLAEKHMGARDLLVAAAIGTEIARPIATAELEFLVRGGDERPGFSDHFASITLGSRDSLSPPAYATSRELPMELATTLEILQRRRIVAANGDTYNFTHPYLRAGAQALAVPDIASDRKRLLEQLERGLACPSPITSLAAAENLRWMRPAFRDLEVVKLFELARSGIRSQFPATRDSCFDFLVQFADQLSPDIRDDLPAIAEGMIVSLDRIDVRSGIGFITNEYNWFGERPSIEAVRPYLEALNTGEPIALDIALSKRILKALERAPEDMTLEVAMRLLRADEAIVRSSAAKLWVSVQRIDDEQVLALIAADRAPSMSAGLTEALGQKWSTLEIPRRWNLASIIEMHCESASCASVVYSRLVRFNRTEDFGSNPPWELFARLMPKVLAHVPFCVSLRNGRLNLAVDYAFRTLEPAALAPVLEVWTQRIVAKVESNFLDEHELGVTEPLLKLDPDVRRYDMISRLLSVRDTGIRVVTLSALIRQWERLSDQERGLTFESLRANKADNIWLKAVALTRRDVPSGITHDITGKPSLADMGPAAIEDSIGSDLFDSCIYVHCGWPQPLWWYGTHHASELWDRIVLELAKRPDHRLHILSLTEVVSHQSSFATELVRHLPLIALPRVYLALLELQAATNAEWRPEFWKVLIERLLQIKSIEELAAEIDPLAEGIFDDIADVKAWLSDGPLSAPVHQLLARDLATINAVVKIASNLETLASMSEEVEQDLAATLVAVRAKIFEGLVEGIEANPPRLHGTWRDVHRALKVLGCSEALLKRVEDGRQEALRKHQQVRDERTGWPCEPLLAGWCNTAALAAESVPKSHLMS